MVSWRRKSRLWHKYSLSGNVKPMKRAQSSLDYARSLPGNKKTSHKQTLERKKHMATGKQGDNNLKNITKDRSHTSSTGEVSEQALGTEHSTNATNANTADTGNTRNTKERRSQRKVRRLIRL